ncbi:MAG TPA: ribosomal protein S18-alanine N-acetyltransferase [Acidimicrobiia bacterium]
MGTPVMTIRPMTLDDLGEVAALEAHIQPRPWSEQVFRDELAADGRTYLVAAGPDAIVGFGGVMVIGDEAHVTNLLVAEESRRSGVGWNLMSTLIGSAVTRGARHVTLEVRSGNEAARALYSRLGLAPVGIRPRYYGDDDALILWAHDIDRPEYLENLR